MRRLQQISFTRQTWVRQIRFIGHHSLCTSTMISGPWNKKLCDPPLLVRYSLSHSALLSPLLYSFGLRMFLQTLGALLTHTGWTWCRTVLTSVILDLTVLPHGTINNSINMQTAVGCNNLQLSQHVTKTKIIWQKAELLLVCICQVASYKTHGLAAICDCMFWLGIRMRQTDRQRPRYWPMCSNKTNCLNCKLKKHDST